MIISDITKQYISKGTTDPRFQCICQTELPKQLQQAIEQLTPSCDQIIPIYRKTMKTTVVNLSDVTKLYQQQHQLLSIRHLHQPKSSQSSLQSNTDSLKGPGNDRVQ